MAKRPRKTKRSAARAAQRIARKRRRVSIQLPRPHTMDVGSAPGIEVRDLGIGRDTSCEPVRIFCADYSTAQVRFQEFVDLKGIQGFLACHRPEWSMVRWITVQGLANLGVIRAIAEKYDLHPLAIEDVLSSQRQKVEDYSAVGDRPGRLFVIARTVQCADQSTEQEQICFFLGRNTLITFQDGRIDPFDGVRRRLSNERSHLRHHDASFLLYSLLDAMIDQFFPVLEVFSQRLERLEDTVLAGTNPKVIEEVHRNKRELMILWRLVWPLRELSYHLHRDTHECLSEMTQTYLRDLYDHVIQIIDFVETYREFAAGLTETYMSAQANRMNDIMKTLTIMTTIFVPLTFVAGVYGMNMNIPENHYSYTYPAFWVFSITVAVGMLLWFRRRGWI